MNFCDFNFLLTTDFLFGRIFFALASPVFHAELYGSMKEEGNVEITDVSFEAFLCLKRYGVLYFSYL